MQFRGVDYPIPGNDDAVRAIALYCDLVSRAALDGMATQMGESFDLGDMAEPPAEAVLDGIDAPADDMAEEPATAG